MEGDVLFPYGRKSAGQVAVDALWEAAGSMGIWIVPLCGGEELSPCGDSQRYPRSGNRLTFSISQRVSSVKKFLDFAKQICLKLEGKSTLNGL